MKPPSVVLPLTLFSFTAAMSAGCSPAAAPAPRALGQSTELGDGMLTTYADLDGNGQPSAIGQSAFPHAHGPSPFRRPAGLNVQTPGEADMPRLTTLTLIAVSGLGVSAAAAQVAADTGYVRLPEAQEIALARSAAPSVVSADATIWTIQDDRYHVARRGANANHCFVARTWAASLEPVCYDEEGARTILPLEIRRFELRRQGLTPADIDRAVESAIGRGELAVPRRPAMSYMMSSAQRLFDDEGRSAGNWKPHVMLYLPYVTDREIGMHRGPTGDLMVVKPGTPEAYVVIVVPDFVDPVPPSRP